jgi:hypothetical protein
VTGLELIDDELERARPDHFGDLSRGDDFLHLVFLPARGASVKVA